MSDNIERSGDLATFASFRDNAWHDPAGAFTFTEEITDFQKILELGHLDGWDVRLSPTFATVNGVELPAESLAVVRNNPFTGRPEIIGSVGKRYEPIQNEESLEFLQHLLDGARWETVGSIKGGRVVFGSLALEREFVLDPDGVADLVKNYLLGYTSHNGTANLTAQPTPIRVVCKNTLNAAINGTTSAYKIRHTKGAGARLEDEIDEAREVLGLTHKYLDAFEVEAQHLYETTVTDKQLEDVINELYPRPEVDKSGSFTKWDTRRDAIFAAWNREDGAGIKGTGWGAWNALTDANQWARAGRGENAEENITVAGMGLDQATNAFRTASKQAVLALA